ncbi:MAG: hypothetical protein HY326_11930 [Chloroflexi bacterium]|nr:hypothetical protein [Chloroflexota bacterium]
MKRGGSDMDALRRWLQEQLDARHMSAHQVSLAAGLNPGFISELMGGEKLGKKGATKLANYLGVTPGFLLYLDGKEEMPTEHQDISGLVQQDENFARLAALWLELSQAERDYLLMFAEVVGQRRQVTGAA